MRNAINSRDWVVSSGYLLVIILGCIDYATGDYSLLLFYLGPVALVTWFQGVRGAIRISLLSALGRYTSDYCSHSALTFKPLSSLEDVGLIAAVSCLVLVMKRMMSEPQR